MQKDYQIRTEDEWGTEDCENFTDLKKAQARYDEMLASAHLDPVPGIRIDFELIEVLRQDCRKG